MNLHMDEDDSFHPTPLKTVAVSSKKSMWVLMRVLSWMVIEISVAPSATMTQLMEAGNKS